MMFWPLAHATFGPEELAAINRVAKSGTTTMGVNVAKFEQEFARYHNMKYGIMVNSGSSANLVAVAALCYKKDNPLKRGDWVVVPAVSWATTYYPLHQYGLKLRVADVDLETLNIGNMPEYLDGVKALVAVSILGNPANLDILKLYAEDNGIYLFEDNCESLDAWTRMGNRTGTFGLVNTFSFFYSHHISTMEGGMILTNDPEMAKLCRSIRNHGWTRGILETPHILDTDTGNLVHDFYPDEKYEFILPGYNVRPLEIAGAIGLEQLKKLPEMTRVRRKNWKLFQHLFGDDERFIIQRENGKSSAFAFTMICRGLKQRPIVFEKLRKVDIGFRMITGGNILRHPVIRHMEHSIVGGSCPNADMVHDAGFFIGNHPYDLEKQIDKLKEVLK
jgi:CDP-4-dehydro-6-deoxyglucose reductase, E1